MGLVRQLVRSTRDGVSRGKLLLACTQHTHLPARPGFKFRHSDAILRLSHLPVASAAAAPPRAPCRPRPRPPSIMAGQQQQIMDTIFAMKRKMLRRDDCRNPLARRLARR